MDGKRIKMEKEKEKKEEKKHLKYHFKTVTSKLATDDMKNTLLR